MIKGVVFDLDGTLVNSIEDIADSMNRVLEEKGYPLHDYANYKTLVGQGIRSLVKSALPEINRDEACIEQSFGQMMDIYDKNCVVKTRLYPGISDLLSLLSDRGIKLAVFSNKANELTQKVVERLMPDSELEIVIGAGGDVPRKPNPKGALLISNKMGIEPKDMMYVGDTGIDMQTAKNSGMKAVGALWGFRDMEELLENGAQILLEHPTDLLDSFS